MIESFKAGIFVLGIGGLILAILLPWVRAQGLSVNLYLKRSAVWMMVTVLVFFVHDFWLLMGGSALLLLWLGTQSRNALATYFFLLFCAPTVSQEISGMGVINQFFVLDYYRLCSLCLLVPCAMKLFSSKSTVRFGQVPTDKFVLTYMLMYLCLQFFATTFTDALRTGIFYFGIDVLIPYFVASRLLLHREDFIEALSCLVIALAIQGAVAVVEFGKGWLLYETAVPALGGIRAFTQYTFRVDALRAAASTGIALVLGVQMMFGFILGLGLLRWQGKAPYLLAPALLAMMLGLLGTLSKGPWLGTAIGLMCMAALLLKGREQLYPMSLVAGATAIGVGFTTTGYEFLQSIGLLSGVIDDNILYRQRLLEVAYNVISDAPFFGAYDFMMRPEVQAMRQGQGIIDIVNAYVGIGLTSGLVGLVLFTGAFVTAIAGIYKRLDDASLAKAGLRLPAVSLIAALSAGMLTIFTCSNIQTLPLLLWTGAGMAVAMRLTVKDGASRPRYGKGSAV